MDYFSFLMDRIFLLLTIVVIFLILLDSDINFNLLGTRYFGIPVNILEFHSGTWLSDLETVWFLVSYFYDLLGGTGAVLILGLIFAPLGKTLLSSLPRALWFMRFCSLAPGNRSYSQLCMSTGTITWHLISLAPGSFLTHVPTSTLLRMKR